MKAQETFRQTNSNWGTTLTDEHSFDVEIFKPVRPMLARRIDPDSVQLLNGYYLEPKLDGERLLCHYSNPPSPGTLQIVFFTRSGNSEYGRLYIDHFKDLLRDNIKLVGFICILDC